MREPDGPPSTHLAAAGILGLKALLGLWAAVVLFTASSTQPHTFLGQAVRRRAGGAGFVLLVFVAATVAVIVGLLQARPWAATATYVLEGLAALASLTRIGRRPGAAILALALSAAVVTLVWMGSSRSRRTAPDPRV